MAISAALAMGVSALGAHAQEAAPPPPPPPGISEAVVAVVNDDIMRALRVSPQQLRDIAEGEGRELIRREAAYRGGRPAADVAG